MFVDTIPSRKGSLTGFTIVELLLVIVTTGIISIVALPKFLDFRTEARVATAQNYINHLRSALANKKTQMMLYCNQGAEVWPRLEAIEMNDITEGGAPEAACTPDQIPNGEDRKFFAQAEITVPTNPYNLLSNIEYTTCTDFCNCEDEAGFLYNIQTGVVGHKLILDECIGRIPASASSESSDSSEGGGESSSEESSESSESSECVPSYAIDEELELCQDVSCDEGYVDLSYCGEGGGGEDVEGCTDPLATNYDLNATIDDYSCEYDGGGGGGCTDEAANNYDSEASYDDGSCSYDEGYGGCTDEAANNYDSEASYDDGSCSYDEGGEEIPGCTSFGANNYNANATVDDGSCTYNEGSGCTDSDANNYNPEATEDDGSCTYGVVGCTTPGYPNYNESAETDNGTCACNSGDLWSGSSCVNPSSYADCTCSTSEGTSCRNYNPVIGSPIMLASSWKNGQTAVTGTNCGSRPVCSCSLDPAVSSICYQAPASVYGTSSWYYNYSGSWVYNGCL